MSSETKDKIYGVEVSKLPPRFLDKIKDFKPVAADGYWKTYAKNPEHAAERIAEFVMFYSKEIVTEELHPILFDRKKSNNSKFNLKK